MNKHKYTNSLIKESSPYLLQHAHNPVNWIPWGNEALEQAQSENKLLIISIGYSACHWCHVMEHETFEDSASASIMNSNFVCIKVDREERPDIDHIYMKAVQILTGRGGWPLNCIALPDGRPIWAGTYLTKHNWNETISSISKFYSENRVKTEEYAEKLMNGINEHELISVNNSYDEEIVNIEGILKIWQKAFDNENGGTNGAPKFMLPNNWLFLNRAANTYNKKEITNQVELTLEKMAFGGIYDQIGGGFARYSTDEVWKVPHFEKMLYDNAQLIQLYSEAHKLNKNSLYKQIVAETVDFLKREFLSPENGFYSALDADSEGVEGKYYVWNNQELESIIGNSDYELFKNYYNINRRGYWEDRNYILFRNKTDIEFSIEHDINIELLLEKVKGWKKLLLEKRSKRIMPGLDNKILCSWNAMTVTALLSAYNAFGNIEYFELAHENAKFLNEKMIGNDGRISHTNKNKSEKISGFLEDYAFTIEAFIALFETGTNRVWLDNALKLTEIAIDDFFDTEKSIFYFTNKFQTKLITRTYELNDNVIPASNSVMARNLFKLSCITGNDEYAQISKKMLQIVSRNFEIYPSAYSNWLNLLLDFTVLQYEIVIVGEKAAEFSQQIQSNFMPNAIICASTTNSDLPLLQNRFVQGKTLIYVCRNKTCMLPVESIDEAIDLIQNQKIR